MEKPQIKKIPVKIGMLYVKKKTTKKTGTCDVNLHL